MGVHGLWKLLEAAGKPVPLESLENKVLAVDVSIWLHQMMKGYQDSRGAPVANAHLLGLFHRVCKLLFYKIKPVFVFDGGVPLLKKQTIAARRKQKAQASQNASEAKERLLKNLVKRKAVRHMLGSEEPSDEQADAVSKDDMFELPPLPENAYNSESEEETQDRLKVFMEGGKSASESESEPEEKPGSQLLQGLKMDLHTLDVNSEEFLSLPPDVRYDILSDLKETRKQNSWGRLHEMPEESGDFSNYQLGRLLKRQSVQVSLEKAEKEMGGKVMRINELQELMTAQGVEIIEDSTVVGSSSQRIASDSRTRFVLCKEATAASSSSQGSDSSRAFENDSIKEAEDNPLFNEQVEFIAKMAENMLQKLVNKQEKSLSQEVILKERKVAADSEELTKVPSDKVLLDSWSDDDDINNTSLDTSKNRKRKSGSSSSELDTNISSSNISPPYKMSRLQESNLADGEVVVNDLAETKNSGKNDKHIKKSDSDTSYFSNNKQCILGADKNKIDNSLKESKSFEIVVHPGEKPEDDLFADIFETKPSENKNEEQKVLKGKAELQLHQSLCKDSEGKQKSGKIHSEDFLKNKPLEIVISSIEAPGDDDIFADIFQKKDEIELQTTVKIEVNSNSDPVEMAEFSSSESETEIIGSDLTTNARVGIVKEEKEAEEDSEVPDQQNELEVTSDNSSEEELESAKTASLVPSLSVKLPVSSHDLNTMEASLEAENIDLLRERGRQERLAASITDQMCVEAQELLQLFGLPFLVAPMEAEAQCAFLDAISLTEGSITDDSDIWLFGGKKVYKNFFNQKKHVLQFTSANISHYFKLSREQLIQLALLVGSDYTTGIQGVGPVTAMEIVAAFQCKLESDPVQGAIKGLSKFKEWWNSGRPHKSNSMRLLDKKLKNVKFSEGFPSQAVVEAYLRPSVENSEETFSWGTLDLPALRLYAKTKFGWTVEKTDEILLPVSKKWSSRTSQRSIESYFNFKPHLVEGLSKISKRVQKAVHSMGNEEDSESVDNPDPIPTTSEKRKSVKKPSGTKKSNSRRAKSKQTAKSSDDESDGDITTNRVTKVKRGKFQPITLTSDNINDELEDGDIAIDNDHVVTNTHSEISDELPVRAPTVPRERSSTGVKRVGLKTSDDIIKKLAAVGDSKLRANICSLEKQKSVRKTPQKSAEKERCSSESDGKQAESSTSSGAKQTIRGLQTKKERIVEKNKVIKNAKEDGPVDEFPDQIPSTSAAGACMSSELAALSEMNWEEDPWDVDNTEKQRPKVFFGGIRPNKPRRPARPRAPNPVEVGDSRGVQPGWVTRERLESRTAWVDDMVRRKREEVIPQRERDQKAMEEAKMKAISVVKATEVRHATRLLGRQTSKRGKGKVKVTRKILPEHNLSESSSDE